MSKSTKGDERFGRSRFASVVPRILCAACLAGLLLAGCSDGDEGATPSDGEPDESDRSAQFTDESAVPDAAVVWDERSPLTLEWRLAGSRDDWRPDWNSGPTPHGNGVAVTVTNSSQPDDQPEQTHWVEVSTDGLAWDRFGEDLPGFAGDMASDGERLAVVASDRLPRIFVDAPEGTWSPALADGLAYQPIPGPAGLLAAGWAPDSTAERRLAVWRLRGEDFIEVQTTGLDDIDVIGDPAPLIHSIGLAQGYLLRVSETTGDGQKSTDRFSPDGRDWSPAEGPNPRGNLIRGNSVGETTIATTDGGLWISHDGTSWVPLRLTNENRAHGVYSSPTGFTVGTNPILQESKVLLSPDGRRWLEVSTPPRLPDADPLRPGIGFAYGQAFEHAGQLLVLDTYGRAGGFGWLGDVTTQIWTAPAVDWP